MTQTVSKSKLKAQMLEYFRTIELTGETLIVTDNGDPVLKIIPLKKKGRTVEEVFKKHRGKVTYNEDLTAPTSDEWDER